MQTKKIFHKFRLIYFNIRHLSDFGKIREVDFYGRDIVTPAHLTPNEVKALIWSAVELKAQRGPSNLLQNKHVTLAFAQASAKLQIAFERAVQELGGQCTSYNNGSWDRQSDMTDCGRLISSLSDIVVTSGLGQAEVKAVADGARIPVINAHSNIFSTVQALADMLTLLETVGPLRRLTAAWVGPPTPLCNAYLCIAPKLGLNLRVCIMCSEGSGQMSAVALQNEFDVGSGTAELHECSSAEEAVYRTDIIVTSKHNVPNKRITLKVLEEAAINWYFLHALPRTCVEVSDEVFRHKNNLTWLSAHNIRFVAMFKIEQAATVAGGKPRQLSTIFNQNMV